MRIASWNVNGLQARTSNLLRWLAERQPDIVGLQELRTARSLPLRRFEDVGYYVAGDDRVALLSLRPIEAVTSPSGDGRTVAGTVGGVRIVNAYAPNGVKAGTSQHRTKVRWLEDFAELVGVEAQSSVHTAVIGDFNVAREPLDVWAPEKYRRRNLFTKEERAAFEKVIANNNLVDVLRVAHDGPGLYTWFNYAHEAFARNRGWRLDYVLASPSLSTLVDHAVVDVEERGRERTSDHAPIWADLSLGRAD